MEGRACPTLAHSLGPSLALGTLSQALYPGCQWRRCWLAEALTHQVAGELGSRSGSCSPGTHPCLQGSRWRARLHAQVARCQLE